MTYEFFYELRNDLDRRQKLTFFIIIDTWGDEIICVTLQKLILFSKCLKKF